MQMATRITLSQMEMSGMNGEKNRNRNKNKMRSASARTCLARIMPIRMERKDTTKEIYFSFIGFFLFLLG